MLLLAHDVQLTLNKALREIYLKPFQIVLQHGQPWAITASYNRVNGLHVSESPQLLQGVLRKD